MSKVKDYMPEKLNTRIWDEIPDSDNPFSASKCFCAGYDVYGEILGNASWVEYLYLLVKQERPKKVQADLLESLAIALANPGPRDLSVRAAMSASVGGSTAASCLMSALAVGAGQNGGAREVYFAVKNWEDCGRDLEKWKNRLRNFQLEDSSSIWPQLEHPPGFDPYGVCCAVPVQQSLTKLSVGSGVESPLSWLKKHQEELESIAGYPVAMTGVAAAAFYALQFDARESEMLFLLLRLPGAAAHALEQFLNWKKYPFFTDKIELVDKDVPDFKHQ